MSGKGSIGTSNGIEKGMREKKHDTSNVVQALKVQGQFQNKNSFGTSNESQQGMWEKERGTNNVIQGMKVQGSFRNKESFRIMIVVPGPTPH